MPPRPRRSITASVRPIRFLIAGAVNTLLTVVLYLGLLDLMSHAAAYTVAFVTGIVISYLLNRSFVFRSNGGLDTVVLFPLVYVVQYIVGLAVVLIWVDVLGLPATGIDRGGDRDHSAHLPSHTLDLRPAPCSLRRTTRQASRAGALIRQMGTAGFPRSTPAAPRAADGCSRSPRPAPQDGPAGRRLVRPHAAIARVLRPAPLGPPSLRSAIGILGLWPHLSELAPQSNRGRVWTRPLTLNSTHHSSLAAYSCTGAVVPSAICPLNDALLMRTQ